MKKSILLLLVGLMLLATMVIAKPTTSLTVPTYCAKTNQPITCAVTYDTSGQTNVTDAYLFYRNTTGGDWGIVQRSTSFNLTTYKFNLTSTAYQDSATFGLNCTVSVNGTLSALNISSSVVTCTSDNTAPVVRATLDYDLANKFQKVDCGILSTDATAGIANYSTNLTKPDSTSVSSSPSNGIQEYGIDDINQPTDSGYTATCLLTDNAGNKGQASATFGVSSLDGQARKAESAGFVVSQVKVGNAKKVIILIGALLIIGISAVMMNKKATKRRR